MHGRMGHVSRVAGVGVLRMFSQLGKLAKQHPQRLQQTTCAQRCMYLAAPAHPKHAVVSKRGTHVLYTAQHRTLSVPPPHDVYIASISCCTTPVAPTNPLQLPSHLCTPLRLQRRRSAVRHGVRQHSLQPPHRLLKRRGQVPRVMVQPGQQQGSEQVACVGQGRRRGAFSWAGRRAGSNHRREAGLVSTFGFYISNPAAPTLTHLSR